MKQLFLFVAGMLGGFIISVVYINIPNHSLVDQIATFVYAICLPLAAYMLVRYFEG